MVSVANPCRSPLFSCRNDRCIMMLWVLDGNNDCIDGSDEGSFLSNRRSRDARREFQWSELNSSIATDTRQVLYLRMIVRTRCFNAVFLKFNVLLVRYCHVIIVVSCYVILCFIMFFFFILCRVMPCLMLCYVSLYYDILFYYVVLQVGPN